MFREYLKNSGKFSKVATGLILIAVLGVIDYQTTSEISFSIFYLLPIAFITWYAGKSYGFIFAVICAVIWFKMDQLSLHEYSNNAIPYWNALVRFGFFVIVVFLMWKIKELKVNLEILVDQRTSDLLIEVQQHKETKENIIIVNNQLRELNKKIENIKEEQNERISREIHDVLGQSLTAINLELMWIGKKHSGNADISNRIQMLSELVSDTINTIRKISSDLRPRLLDQLGIFPAIESQLKEFRKRTSIKFAYSYPEEELAIDNSTSITIFRIFQEALTNIARHSKCTFVNVNFSLIEKSILSMSVKDNGIGFEFNKTKNINSLGIVGMKERTSIINGFLDFISEPGKGTEINLKIPI